MDHHPPSDLAFLSGGGEMGERLRTFDFSTTPLGPVSAWPHSLRSAVGICLNSRFPMVLWWGPDQLMIYNDAWRPVLGQTKHPAIGKRGRDVWPEIWHIIGPMLHSVLETGQATWQDDQLLMLDRNGYLEEAYFTYSYSPIHLEDGRVGGAFSAVSETTGRFLGERRLHTLRDLGAQAALAKTAEHAIDNAMRTLTGNQADVPFGILYLASSDESHLTCSGIAPLGSVLNGVPETVPLIGCDADFSSNLREAFRTGRAVLLENIQKSAGPLPSGPWPVSANRAIAIPLNTPGQQRSAGMLVAGINPCRAVDADYETFLQLLGGHIATSISNARAYEEERRRAEALAELDRAKTAFFSNVSHELRTPLTLMLGPLEELKTEFGHSSPSLHVSEYRQIDVVYRNGLRLLKLVNQLLDFSRIEAGREQATYEETDLAAFTAELASVFRSAVEKAGLSLIVNCPPMPEPVFVDRDMWEKIVLNLLSNAFKFTFEGEIEVKLRPSGQHVELSIRDTGTGIPDDQLGKIFERFHRVAGSQGRTYEGTGIGLALVQELTRLHGGSVSVESAYGHGSTFRVFIPLGKSHLPHKHIGATRERTARALNAISFGEEAAHWLPSEKRSNSGALKVELPVDFSPSPSRRTHARVLIADDNADMRGYVGRLLASQNYAVEAVADGQAALDRARANPPDIVLTDIMMPRLDGFGLLKALRADERTRTLPIIMLSARAGEEARVEGLGAGADDYLIKPFSARELLARVRSHLDLARLRKENEDRVSRILGSITDGFQTIGADYRFIYFNEAARRTFLEQDMNPDELIGRHILDEVFPAERDKPWAVALRRTMVERVPTEVETFYEPWQHWFAARYYPGPDGGVSVFFQDITERKRAENAVCESEEQFRAVFSQTTGGIAQTDLTSQFTLVNDRYCDIVGRSREELLTMRMHEITHPDDLPDNAKQFSALIQGGPSFVVEKRYLRQDGSVVWVHNDVAAVRDSRGQVSHVVAAVTDITGRKMAEALLAEQSYLMEKIAAGRPLDEILTELCSAVPKLNPRARACILLADEERKTISGSITPDVMPAFGVALQDAPINDLCIGTCGEAIYSGKSVTCTDVTKDERWSKMWRDLCLNCGIFAGYSKPVRGSDGLPLASFFLCFGEPHIPDDSELKLAEFGAHVASIALERERAYEVQQRDLENAHRLQEISAQLIQEDNVRVLYELILDAALGIMQSDCASIQILDSARGNDGELRLLGFRGFNHKAAAFWEWVRSTSKSTCGVALQTGKQCIVPDVEQCEFMAGTGDLETYLQAGIHAVQTTPLLSRSGRLVGMISTHWRQTHRPSERDLRLFDVLARMAADLIERSQVERSIRESEARFRAFINATSDVVYRMSPDWTEMRHLQGREFIADTLEPSQIWLNRYIHPDDQQQVMATIQRAIQTKSVFELEHRVIRVDGSLGWTCSRAIPIMDDCGEIVEWFGAASDVSQRKEAEEALRRLNDELEHRVTNRTRDLVQSQERLRAMATELNLAEQRERKRLATELHDHLQQTLVLGKITVGQGKRLSSAVPASLEVMKKIDDIFADALIYTRTLVADLSPPVLRDHGLLAGLKWLGEYMKKHQIDVTVTVPEKDKIELPEDQALLLFQSVRELLINSAKHAGTRQANVDLEWYDGQLRIKVSDQGAGFDLAAVSAAAGTSSAGISSKFGLFSIEERMRALGGLLELESAHGKGTTAILMLPLLSHTDGKMPSAKLSGIPRTSLSKLKHNAFIRVLLVDDHTMMRQGLRSIVTAYDHLEVVGEAGDGAEAVELAKLLNPDVVVMDINMPKMDGIEATQWIKANQPATVVIGLSVNQSADTEQKMKAAGAFTYLTKESAADVLCQAIEQAVSYKWDTVESRPSC